MHMLITRISQLFLSALCSLPAADQRADILLADFEGADYGVWEAEGEAFGPGPARGTLPGQMRVTGYEGKGLVNSFFQGDGTTGTLMSPEFRLERHYLNFLVGGGGYPEETYVELLVGGRPVRKATGPNTEPGGSEMLAWHTWDVQEFLGEAARIRIVDRRMGGWGHINADHFVLSDQKAPQVIENARREFRITKRYLNIPIKNGGPMRKLTLLLDGEVQVRNDIELADADPDWWAFMDVSEWRDRTITLQVDKLAETSGALTLIEQSDSLKGAEDLYRERLRGQFHFSSRRGWLNDPNGLVFYNGEYHLFYQHNPYGWNWGNMHWGHAVSRDLVHWRELGDVLAPDRFGPMFSGSAVVDVKNTSGLGKNGQPPVVLIYTAAGNPALQCVASSTDGRAFTKFAANPVLKQITPGNRDPKVIWHEPSGRWVMVLYVGLPGNKHTVQFFTSTDLREWSRASVIEGGTGDDRYLYECPDFFELPLDGDPGRSRWVLLGANTEYAIGTFDGIRFTPEFTKLPGQRGRGFYAPQTFSDVPAADGRRIQIGWLQTSTPGMPFNQSMSLPLELRLVTTGEGPRLTWTPVKELQTLRAETRRFDQLILKPAEPNPLADIRSELLELRAEVESQVEVTFSVRGATITLDPAKQEIVVNGQRAPAPARQGKQTLVVYCDRTALEVFTGDGLTYIPMPHTPGPDDCTLAVAVREGSGKVRNLEIHTLTSAWEGQR
jgi:fructan beta-fructosidase